MKTAEEILNKAYARIIKDNNFLSLTVKDIMGLKSHAIILDAINTARKEAIEECAGMSLLNFKDVRTLAIKKNILLKIKELK